MGDIAKEEEKNGMGMVSLSEKDREYREFALNADMWKVIFRVCFPLAVFQFIAFIFNILDTMMASHISAEAVSAVAYLSQLQSMIAAVGTGLSVGGSIQISKAYGAGEFELVKKRLSSLLAICFGIALLVLALMPFAPAILRLSGTPDTFVEIGAEYFTVTLAATMLSFFNNIYIAIERARGNSKRIMYLNTCVIVLKLSLTAVFVYWLKADITMIAVATVISQAVLLLFAIKNLSSKKDVFGFSPKFISFQSYVVNPIIRLSFPVIVEKVAFAFGKTVINVMSKRYGERTVGALGISNNVSGSVTCIQNAFQDGGASIISQNLGGHRLDRAIDAFKKILLINIVWGFAGWLLVNIFMNQIAFLFANSANGLDTGFQETIIKICRYDTFGSCVPLGINSAVMSLLFGLGYTKLTLFINFCRIFLFRIPVLWALQNLTDLGSESVGIVMMVSNIMVALLSALVCFFVLRHVKQKHNG